MAIGVDRLIPKEQSNDPKPPIGLDVRRVNQLRFAQRNGKAASRRHSARLLLKAIAGAIFLRMRHQIHET
jgi:hypothetical protein